jgi:hypothetical protein
MMGRFILVFLQSENERLPYLTQGEVVLPVHLVRIQPDVVHAPGLSGYDTGVMQLNMTTLTQTDVSVTLFSPDFN